VYNKRDQVDSKEFVPTLFPNVLISTKISEDKERLVQAIRAQMMELLEPYQLEISPTDGQLLSELRRMTLMISEEYAENENRYIVKGFAKKKSKWLAESEKE
ncbi:TPA: GTPase HflX, partial [Enterococcus faecalis]|nr:GTPase HflX [Enterococcus faecalis]